MTENRISAGELRAIGMRIPENIPDCATVRRSAMKMKVDECKATGDVLTVDIFCKLLEPFEWIEVNFSIKDAEK